MLLFVYGTLKKGFWNDYFLRNCKYLGSFKTVNNFCLIVNSGCPFVASTPSMYPIHGEVYDVDDVSLKEIDFLESNGSVYTRKLIAVMNTENEQQVMSAEIYLKENATGEIQEKGIY